MSSARTRNTDVICRCLFFLMFNKLRWAVVVCFVDIGGIVDHHCLNFFHDVYIILITTRNWTYACFVLSTCWSIWQRGLSVFSGARTAQPSRTPEVFCGVRVIRSLVLCVCFVDRCLSFCPFSFGHFVVCPSSIYGFRLPFWYLQTLSIFNLLPPFSGVLVDIIKHCEYQCNKLDDIIIRQGERGDR